MTESHLAGTTKPLAEIVATVDLDRAELRFSSAADGVAKFKLFVSPDAPRRSGRQEVRRKRVDPIHYDPRGAATPPDFVGPFPRQVIELSGGLFLHGLPAWDLLPLSLGLSAEDAAVVFERLQPGMSVDIVAAPAPLSRSELASAIERLPLIVGPARRAAQPSAGMPAASPPLAPLSLEPPVWRGTRSVIGWHPTAGEALASDSTSVAPRWLSDRGVLESWQAAAPAIDWPLEIGNDVANEASDEEDDDEDLNEVDRADLLAMRRNARAPNEEIGAAWPAPTGWQVANLALSLATLVAVVWPALRGGSSVASNNSPLAPVVAVAPPTSHNPPAHLPPARPTVDPDFSVPAYPDRGPGDVARVNYTEGQPGGAPTATSIPPFDPAPQVPRADLKLNVYVPQTPLPVGGNAVYEIRVANKGTAPATAVLVSAYFSEGFEPIGAEGAPPKLAPGQVEFERIPQIDPGQERAFRVIARADSPGPRIFRPDVKCGNPDTHLFTDVTTQFYQADAPARQ